MARYLVAGTAGFIGARVSEMLLEQGHQVTGLDDLNDAYDVRLKQWRLARLSGREGFSFCHCDINRFEQVQKTFADGPAFDAVINLAARAGVRYSVENPWIYVDTNMSGTLNLLEGAARYNCPKFVLASTSSIYGANAPLPTPESADSDHPLQPYAASKKGAEAMCHAYHFLHGIDVTVFRYFTVYGPAGRPDMVMFRFVQWLFENRTIHLNGDGSQNRGFTYIDDIARGTIAGLKPLGYEVINLGGHEVISINEMLSRLECMIGERGEISYHQAHAADMLANHADVTKARTLLGWEPQVSLDEGMRQLVDWYRAEREWAREIDTSQ